MSRAIDLQILDQEQEIADLLDLQQKLVMSEQPKELSRVPQAIRFKVDIRSYLPSHFHKPIYGCIFSDEVAMNAALLRAGLYVHTKMGIVDDATVFHCDLMKHVAGHDFNGRELAAYGKQPAVSAPILPEYKQLREIEREFNQQVILPITQSHQDDFSLFAIMNTKRFKDDLSHELLHAQYYNSPQTRAILAQTWQQVSPADQQTIVSSLRNGGYDMDQEELLLREFYSYFLQHNAEEHLASVAVIASMAGLADRYGHKIRAALELAGIPVLKVT